MPFQVSKGTNISHWLSQSNRRGAERAAWFTEKDVQYIAGLRGPADARGLGGGFDHLRIPIDEEQMWDKQGRKEAQAFDLLDAALVDHHDLVGDLPQRGQRFAQRAFGIADDHDR